MQRVSPVFCGMLGVTLAAGVYTAYADREAEFMGYTRCVDGDPVVWVEPGLGSARPTALSSRPTKSSTCYRRAQSAAKRSM